MPPFDQALHEPPGFDPAAHPSFAQLRRTTRRLRRRLLAANAAAGLLTALAPLAGGGLATPLLGGYTVGMLLLGLQVAALLGSAAWYERACRTHGDPHADALAAAAHDRGRARP